VSGYWAGGLAFLFLMVFFGAMIACVLFAGRDDE